MKIDIKNHGTNDVKNWIIHKYNTIMKPSSTLN